MLKSWHGSDTWRAYWWIEENIKRIAKSVIHDDAKFLFISFPSFLVSFAPAPCFSLSLPLPLQIVFVPPRVVALGVISLKESQRGPQHDASHQINGLSSPQVVCGSSGDARWFCTSELNQIITCRGWGMDGWIRKGCSVDKIVPRSKAHVQHCLAFCTNPASWCSKSQIDDKCE